MQGKTKHSTFFKTKETRRRRGGLAVVIVGAIGQLIVPRNKRDLTPDG
jgi:hypothetical protein